MSARVDPCRTRSCPISSAPAPGVATTPTRCRASARRGAAAGALRPRAGAGERHSRGDRRAAAHAVALPRGTPGPRPRARHDPGRGDDAAAPAAGVRRGDRRTGTADEGRRPDPHRHLQGSRRGRRRVPRAGARREGRGDADERQRRRRLVGVRRAGRPGQPDRDAGRCPRDHPARVRGGRCGAVPGRRPDQPRRRAGQGGGRGAQRIPGGLDPQGAVPHRGQEDDGLRDRRAARLAGARRDPLPGRRWRRSDRDPQGDAGDAGARLDRRPAARGWSPCSRPGARRS